jgi:hypothetical protein
MARDPRYDIHFASVDAVLHASGSLSDSTRAAVSAA